MNVEIKRKHIGINGNKYSNQVLPNILVTFCMGKETFAYFILFIKKYDIMYNITVLLK